METTAEKILEKILLPVNEDWHIETITVEEHTNEINVYLRYKHSTVLVDNKEVAIYDLRESRRWRHLDLWQYRTYLHARMPRYKSGTEYKTIEVPWADVHERMTYLLEKK